MVIIGIGSDLCNIERIQHSLDRWGDKFIDRVFTDTERAKAERRPFTRAGTYARIGAGCLTSSPLTCPRASRDGRRECARQRRYADGFGGHPFDPFHCEIVLVEYNFQAPPTWR